MIRALWQSSRVHVCRSKHSDLQHLLPRTAFHTLIEPAENDDLRISELMLWFRERGHMVAKLDPLGRVERGVWRGELSHSRPVANRDVESLLEWVSMLIYHHVSSHISSQLMQRYPYNGDQAYKAHWLSTLLGLGGADPLRQLQVDPSAPSYMDLSSSHMLTKVPSILRRTDGGMKWTLPDLFEHLASSYSGTLAAQVSRMTSQ